MPLFTDPHFVAMAALVAQATGLPGPPTVPEIVDWQAIRSVGRYHHALSLALPALAQRPDLPGGLLAEFRRDVLGAARVGLAQIAAQTEICRLLNGAGIRFLVLKGTPLSLLLFGDPVRRCSGDVDLLVAPGDFAAASRVLHDAGFRPLENMPVLTGDPAHDGSIRDLSVRRGSVLLELHQRLTGNPQRLPFGFDELYAGRQMVQMGDGSVPTLGPAHLGIYLFVHGACHGWQRLSWLTDIALLCRDRAAASCLVQHLHSLDMTRAGGQAFALMAALLGCPPPPGIRVPARPGWLTRRSAQGYQGPTRGPVWFIRILFYYWAGWRLRGGLGAFLQAMAYDLAPSPIPGHGRRGGWRLLLRPLRFLWRNLR